MSISQEPQQAYGYGRRHLIFINGELINGIRIADFLKPDDFLIGVDGGTNHIVSLGLTPDVVLGDLDSISPETLRIVQDKRIRTLRHPADKDQTDLELAIEFRPGPFRQLIFKLLVVSGGTHYPPSPQDYVALE